MLRPSSSPLRIWEVLSVYPQISYEELMKLDVESELITQPHFEEEFGLSDNELAERLPYFYGNAKDITRLSALYKLHVEQINNEFTEYLNTLPLDLALTIFVELQLWSGASMETYFAQRMPTDSVMDYVRYFVNCKCVGEAIMNPVFIKAMQWNTKNYDEEIVKQLIELMEEFDSTNQYLEWIPAVIPYGPDWLIEETIDDGFQDDERLEAIYSAALINSEQRLSYIIDYISKYRSYDNQLQAYLDVIEDWEFLPANYGTIVTTLASKVGKSLTDLDFAGTMFETWKFDVLNTQV